MSNNYRTLGEPAPKEIYGGKAYGLSWLNALGYNVPPALFIPATLTDVQESELFPLMEGYFSSSAAFAVRSSALTEDGMTESFAGHYATFTEIDSLSEILEKITHVKGSNPTQMGVIVQQYIRGAYSGVAFSSDPNSGFLGKGLISFAPGNGEDLVSGRVSGNDVEIHYTGDGYDPTIGEIKAPNLRDHLIDVARIAKQLEVHAGHPVDIEWCVSQDTGELFLLQCRPITSILFPRSECIQVQSSNFDRIPKEVRGNDKISLRLACSNDGIATSKAFVLVLNRPDETTFFQNEDLGIHIPCNPMNDGYSSILIAPQKLEGNVLRAFAGNDLNEVKRNIQSIFNRCFEFYWRGIVILHELLPLDYMGIIKKTEGCYVIELSKGGFIQKGLTGCSRFVLDLQGNVITRDEQTQTDAFEIGSKGVQKVAIHQRVSLPDQVLSLAVKTFENFLADNRRVVEFGLHQHGSAYVPYLIDYQLDEGAMDMETIKKGVISKGKITGRLQLIDLGGDWKKGVETHYHDDRLIVGVPVSNEPIIFVADRPDITLLRMLDHYNAASIGFLFKGGSMLSHLCIVLREKGIPAIFLPEGQSCNEGDFYTIDA
jgi:hypothetical protein